ncbi:nucleotide-binding alpha-beta plait domain-containing protein [Tanacetum coccineum]
MVSKTMTNATRKEKRALCQNVVNFFFTNFPPEWNKANLHDLFVEVGEISDVYVARKLTKAGKRFGFARFFRIGNLQALEKRLNGIRIGSFRIKATIAKFEKYVSMSKQASNEGLVECKPSASNLRRIQVKDIVKEVEDYLKTYTSTGMDISWYNNLAVNYSKICLEDNSIKQNGGTKVVFNLATAGASPPLSVTTITTGPPAEDLCLKVDAARHGESHRTTDQYYVLFGANIPSCFFDVMIHLVMHLPEEAILGGPVYMRWMYPFENETLYVMTTDGESFKIHSLVELESIWLSVNATYCNVIHIGGSKFSLEFGNKQDVYTSTRNDSGKGIEDEVDMSNDDGRHVKDGDTPTKDGSGESDGSYASTFPAQGCKKDNSKFELDHLGGQVGPSKPRPTKRELEKIIAYSRWFNENDSIKGVVWSIEFSFRVGVGVIGDAFVFRDKLYLTCAEFSLFCEVSRTTTAPTPYHHRNTTVSPQHHHHTAITPPPQHHCTTTWTGHCTTATSQSGVRGRYVLLPHRNSRHEAVAKASVFEATWVEQVRCVTPAKIRTVTLFRLIFRRDHILHAQWISFMSRVIATLDRAQRDGHFHGLLELPTRTGKSLSFLCSVIAWQKNHKAKAGYGFISKADPEAMDDPFGRGRGAQVSLKIHLVHAPVEQATRISTNSGLHLGNMMPTLSDANNKTQKKKRGPVIYYATTAPEYRIGTSNNKLLIKVSDRKNIRCREFLNAPRIRAHPSVREGGCYEVHDIEDLVKLGEMVIFDFIPTLSVLITQLILAQINLVVFNAFDAMKLHEDYQVYLGKYELGDEHRKCWNEIKDDPQQNKKLDSAIMNFLYDGETYKNQAGFELVASAPFEQKDFPGYHPKQGCGKTPDGPFRLNDARTLVYKLLKTDD